MASPGPPVAVWETTGSGSAELSEHAGTVFGSGPAGSSSIVVDPTQTFQTMVGFGGTLTDASAVVLTQDTTSTTYNETMEGLFSPTTGIGLDLLRVPIGGNDFSLGSYAGRDNNSNNYNEDSREGPRKDPLKFFSIRHDRAFLIPVLRRALALNPSLQIIATPWSAPGWMKTGGSGYDHMDGGSLNSKYISDYAQYLVDFIMRYRRAHVPIGYLTLQNEPLNATSSYPSVEVSAAQEEVIARDVNRDLASARLSVQILGFDHNWYQWSYARSLLTSSSAEAFAGVAFHCYGDSKHAGNDPSQGQPFFDEFPDTQWLETECTPLGSYASASNPRTSSGSFSQDLLNNTRAEDIESVIDGSSSAMLFNIALDNRYGPTINKNCLPPHSPCLPLVAVNSRGRAFYQVGYYALGQLSKFVRPGAVRIAATSTNNTLQTVAFENPDGSIVLTVLNTTPSGVQNQVQIPFTVSFYGEAVPATIPTDSVQTFVWNPPPVVVPAIGPTLVDVGDSAGNPSVDDTAFNDFAAATGQNANVESGLPSSLSGYRCVLFDINEQFDAGDAAKLQSFLAAGGTVLAVGEHEDGDGFDTADGAINSLLGALGAGAISLNDDKLDDNGDEITTSITQSPLTAGVQSLQDNDVSSLTVAAPAQTLVYTSDDATAPLVAYEPVGAGTVVLSGDSNMFSDNNDDAYQVADNGTFAKDLCP